MTLATFTFLDAPTLLPLIDHELELVEPHACHILDLLAASHHPLTKKEMPLQSRTTRDSLTTFVNQNPNGHTLPDDSRGIAPTYTFWMRIRAGEGINSLYPQLPTHGVTIAGSISLRIGHNENLDYYLGHIGYHVLPPARGRHYAARACKLLLPLARLYQHQTLWITCNPDNTPSRLTCERIGAQYINTVPVPLDNSLYTQGDRQKCRYRIDL